MSEKRIRNYEVKCLLELLSILVNEKEVPKWNQQPEWGNLYKMADYHGVANMIYYALLGMDEKKLEPWRPKFEERFHQAVLGEERYSTALPEILEVLEENKIHCLVLQEYRMRHYYLQKDMRALKHIRILVEKGKENMVRELLKHMDYEERDSRTAGEEWYYKIPGVLAIIQTEFLFTNKKMQKYFSLPIKNYEKEKNHKYIHTFVPEEYYIHVIAHMAESYARGNLDIRSMVDVWLYYIKVYSTLEWRDVNKELEYLKLEKFHLYIIQLAAYWFGDMLFPENDHVFDAMEKYILTKGMQGRKISATVLPLVTEVADFYKKDLRQKQRDQIMDWAFPKMDYMNTMFPSLQKIEWLLPFYWCVRLWRLAWQQAVLMVRKRWAAVRVRWHNFWVPKKEAVEDWVHPKREFVSRKIRNFRRRVFALDESIRIKLVNWMQKIRRKP